MRKWGTFRRKYTTEDDLKNMNISKDIFFSVNDAVRDLLWLSSSQKRNKARSQNVSFSPPVVLCLTPLGLLPIVFLGVLYLFVVYIYFTYPCVIWWKNATVN